LPFVDGSRSGAEVKLQLAYRRFLPEWMAIHSDKVVISSWDIAEGNMPCTESAIFYRYIVFVRT
jgi:hypothetical protein